MNLLIKKTATALLLIYMIFFFAGCEKIAEESRPYNNHVDLTIDGKEYRNSIYMFPILKPVYPMVGYEYSDYAKRFSIVTDCVPHGNKEYLASDVLALGFYIFLDEELEIGKKYYVHSLPDLDYMTPYGTEDLYRERKVSYCYLKMKGYLEGYCFGEGYVELTKISLEKNDFEGTFEFNIPFSKEKQDNPPIVNVKGKFKAIK